MEIQCVNRCGNLTDTPDSDMCETCREMSPQKFYDVVWQDGKSETLKLSPEQAVNLSMTSMIKSVVPVNG